MIKREIKRFNIESAADGIDTHGEAPITLYTLLTENNETYEEPSGIVEFNAEVFADEAMIEAKYLYLRIRDVKQPATLYINNEFVGEIDGNSPSHSFSVKGRLAQGENVVSLRFDTSECKYPGMIGLFSPPELLRFDGSVIDRVHISQTHADGIVTVGIKLDLLGSLDNVRAVATLTSPSGQLYYAGLTRGEGSIKINDPLYWMPRDFGVQNVYKLSINLYRELDVEDSVDMRIGLRTIEKADPDARALLVNGARVMPMGATYQADELPNTHICVSKEEAYVNYAAMAHYNTFVLPAGAPRPSNRFFDLCDRHGIMVIEETDTLDHGMLDAIENRAHHPSYALLEVVSEENSRYIAGSLATVVPELDFLILSEKTRYISAPSLPSDKTLAAVVPYEERNLFSRAVESIAGEGTIGKMMLSVYERYPYPATLSDFAYASALAAATKVGEVVKESRMTRGESGRAIFERFGDSVAAVSSSAIDAYSRWKPMQYYASRYFAPVVIYAEQTKGGVLFSVSNERKLDFIGTIEYRVATATNTTLYQGSEECEVSAMTSRELFTRDFSEYTQFFEDSYYIEYSLKEVSSVLSRGTLLACPEKYFRFQAPNIKYEISGSDRNFSITLTSSVFARCVEIDFMDVDAVFSDNYFDLTSDTPVKINVTLKDGPQSIAHLQDSLQIRSMYDIKL